MSIALGRHYPLHDHTHNLGFFKPFITLGEQNLYRKSSVNRIMMVFSFFYLCHICYLYFLLHEFILTPLLWLFLHSLSPPLMFPLSFLEAHHISSGDTGLEKCPKPVHLLQWASVSLLGGSQTVCSLQAQPCYSVASCLPQILIHINLYQIVSPISLIPFPFVEQTPPSVF